LHKLLSDYSTFILLLNALQTRIRNAVLCVECYLTTSQSVVPCWPNKTGPNVCPSVRMYILPFTSIVQFWLYSCSWFTGRIHRLFFKKLTRSSSGDEIATVNCFTTSDTYCKVQQTCAKIMAHSVY